jgi:hypothetical protein
MFAPSQQGVGMFSVTNGSAVQAQIIQCVVNAGDGTTSLVKNSTIHTFSLEDGEYARGTMKTVHRVSLSYSVYSCLSDIIALVDLGQGQSAVCCENILLHIIPAGVSTAVNGGVSPVAEERRFCDQAGCMVPC